MPYAIPYKSFCWSLGTTSFRTKNFNKTIEEQLSLLNEFWNLRENFGDSWNSNSPLQSRYYDYMHSKGFLVGIADNKPKDAREKTSGLVDIGLVDDGRKLTAAGRTLLEISESNNFNSDNFFQIPKDSFLYLKQLLKTFNCVNGENVRPFIVLLYVLSKVQELSLDDYTYLLPLCTTKHYTDEIISQIEQLRAGNTTVDNIIIDRLLDMDNYQRALSLLLQEEVDTQLLCEVGLNRKSRAYDAVYYPLYKHLYSVYVNGDMGAVSLAFAATHDIKIGNWWKKRLFNTQSVTAIKRNPASCINPTLFDGINSEAEFKTAFFKTMHLLKAKATLSDYLDLNRRYIKTTDVVLFEDNVVKLDIIPKHFFGAISEKLYSQAFTASDRLTDDCSLQEISECLVINEPSVIESVNAELGTDTTTIAEVHDVVESARYSRLQRLIDTKFTDEKILILLDCFEARNDSQIRNMVTDNADIPTIFEYVLGIMWYKTSERQGKILDYMKLSLDADLLPKTHAAGGEADIVYEYSSTEFYPEHTLLIEATLADTVNQRRMEMEPVSRHLGQHLIKTGNTNSYCVFATNYLHINVISDFRSRKITPYYNPQDYSQSINGMKIIPLQTSELKQIISTGRKYKELYPLFEEAYNSALPPHLWYESAISNPLGQ